MAIEKCCSTLFGNNNILLRVISLRLCILTRLTPFFLSSSFTDTNKHTHIFKGERMLHCHYQWTQRLGEERRKREGGREGEGWDKIHQIWWHGDVDNVFSFQLSSEKRRQNTTTFTLSHPLFWMKGSTMYRVCVSNVSLCAQTPCPFTYQNDCPTIMWFNGKTHILLIWLSGRGSTGLQSTGGEKRKKKKKREENVIIQFLICLHKYDRKPPQKPCDATVICRRETLENKCVEEM